MASVVGLHELPDEVCSEGRCVAVAAKASSLDVEQPWKESDGWV